jgi:hypothetical protein
MLPITKTRGFHWAIELAHLLIDDFISRFKLPLSCEETLAFWDEQKRREV